MDLKIQKSKELFLLGVKHFQNDDLLNAEKFFKESLSLTPDRISVVNNLIQIYIKKENEKNLEKILNKIDNNNIKSFEARSGKAYLLFFKKKYDESINLLKKIKFNNINEEKFLLNLEAKVLEKKNEFDNAKLIYKKIINISKHNPETIYNYGLFLMNINKTIEALNIFNKILDDYKNIKNRDRIIWHKSLCLLRLKKIEGYKIYKPTLQSEKDKKIIEIKELTKIDDLIKNPSKVLIWGDQGYGDMIMFSRFAKYITIKFNIKINLSYPKKIKELFQNFDANINLIDENNLNLDNFDYQIRLSCLPKVIQYKDFNNIEFYKLNLQSKSSDLQKKLPNVGLAWTGRTSYKDENLRSIPLNYFENLLKKNIQFYKLQKDINENDKNLLNKYSNVIDLGNKNFLELAYAIKQLDLVISCDTAIIHLAGILNVKSYLMLNYNSHWTWFDDSKENIWYPSVEIVRQIKNNNWNDEFAKIDVNIEQLYV